MGSWENREAFFGEGAEVKHCNVSCFLRSVEEVFSYAMLLLCEVFGSGDHHGEASNVLRGVVVSADELYVSDLCEKVCDQCDHKAS